MTIPPSTVVGEVADIATTSTRLAEIADQYPSLHPQILAHPALYDGLRQWIDTYAREHATASGSAAVISDDTTMSSPAPAPSVPAPAQPVASGWTMLAAVLAPLGVVTLVVVACTIAFTSAVASAESQYLDYAYDEEVSEPAFDEPLPSDESNGGSIVDDSSGAGTAVNRDCEALYSRAMRAQLEGAGLTLNPARVQGLDYVGTRDAVLASYITQPLECVWMNAQGDTPTWIITTISQIRPGEQSSLEQRLAAYTTVDMLELGGHRYVTDAVTSGESHLVRDGLWFATTWNTFGPDGYTADIVLNYFG